MRFAKPLARTREYVDIVKLAIARKPVAYDGEHYTLPLPGGAGKALRLGFHPPRDAVPLYLAAVGPKNLELAGEIADGCWRSSSRRTRRGTPCGTSSTAGRRSAPAWPASTWHRPCRW